MRIPDDVCNDNGSYLEVKAGYFIKGFETKTEKIWWVNSCMAAFNHTMSLILLHVNSDFATMAHPRTSKCW